MIFLKVHSKPQILQGAMFSSGSAGVLEVYAGVPLGVVPIS